MRNARWQKIAALLLVIACACSVVGCKGKEEKGIILKNVAKAKNVILLIGDGMGPNQVKAGEVYNEGKLAMQKFPYSVKVETRSASSEVTDSSAAATALATGVRIWNSWVGMTGEEEKLETIIDIAAQLGKRTGVITTEELYGATPMGFSSHNRSRSAKEDLLTEAARTSNVNLFLSYTYEQENILTSNGYTRIDNPADISEATGDKLCGSYNINARTPSMTVQTSVVALDGLVVEALEYLSKDEDGFFLMAEGAHIDHGGHNNDFEYMVSELMAFDMAVEAVLEWAKDRDDTVVIVTADHETGGLALADGINKENMFKASGFNRGGYYQWMTKGHTAEDVFCFINGADISFENYSFGDKNRITNTDIFKIMKSLMVS